jgi:hypothetical protein
VFTESVRVAIIKDELQLARERVCAGTRSAFTDLFLDRLQVVKQRVIEALAADPLTWQGNLAAQASRYEDWMAKLLATELAPLSQEAVPLAVDLLGKAEERFRRIVEAFRDRIGRNLQEATGVTVSPVAWEVKRPSLPPKKGSVCNAVCITARKMSLEIANSLA